MAKTVKYVVGAGAALVALVMLGLGLRGSNGGSKQVAPTVLETTPERTLRAEPDSKPEAAQPAMSVPEITIEPLPANAASVPDEDLLKLSAMVNLANAENQPADKKRWEQALAVAEQLVQGPCDCEQRNWLNHFVEMGGYALSGADESYYRLAHLMPKLARNDSQVTEYVQRTSN